jgi:hypothetical protein
MADRDDFLTWVNTALCDAERALHNGDMAPSRALWSRNEPVNRLRVCTNRFHIDAAFRLIPRPRPAWTGQLNVARSRRLPRVPARVLRACR